MEVDASHNLSSLQEGIFSASQPLLTKKEQEEAHGKLGGISIDNVASHNSSANRGYRPPTFSSSGPASIDHSIAAAASPERRSLKTNLFSKVATMAERFSSAIAFSPSQHGLSPEIEEKEIISLAVKAAHFLLEKSNNEEDVRSNIENILEQVDRFTFYKKDRPDDWRKEIDKVIAKAQEEILTRAQSQATKLLQADPSSQQKEKEALTILKKAFLQATPFQQRASLGDAAISKKAEEFLIEVRTKL